MLGEEVAPRTHGGRPDPGTARVPGRLSRPYVSQLERGLRSPTLDTLFLLCDAPGVSAADVVAPVEAERERTRRR